MYEIDVVWYDYDNKSYVRDGRRMIIQRITSDRDIRRKEQKKK